MTRAISSKTRKPWWQRPWIVPLLVVILAFLAYQVNRFWGVWGTSEAPVSPHGDFAPYFPLLGAHIVCGFTAMFTAAIQVWPRIRRDHPVVHRVSGRIYVVVALAGGTAGLLILRFAPPVGRVGAIVETVLWMATAATGFVQARRGNFVAHRQLMLYSFATLMSTVWGSLIAEVGLALPVTIDAVYLNYLFEAARWAGFLANLMIVQWWLLRTANRPIEFGPTGRRADTAPVGRLLPAESD